MDDVRQVRQADTLQQNPVAHLSVQVGSWVKYGRPAIAELLGTYLLVLFGTGSVATGVITQSLVGLGQVASVWGIGVAIAIYCTASVSGAHLNPAVTFSYALLQEIKPFIALIYVCSQFVGAVLASGTNYLILSPFIYDFEKRNNITRGYPGSERSAMIFGEYFPNPTALQVNIGSVRALMTELLGTCILMFVIMNVTHKCNTIVGKGLAPLLIGMTVAALISIFAPINQVGLNPARDFGPRLIALSAGWGADIAMKGCWVYIIGPLIGAPVGAFMFEVLLKKNERECYEDCQQN